MHVGCVHVQNEAFLCLVQAEQHWGEPMGTYRALHTMASLTEQV